MSEQQVKEKRDALNATSQGLEDVRLTLTAINNLAYTYADGSLIMDNDTFHSFARLLEMTIKEIEGLKKQVNSCF